MGQAQSSTADAVVDDDHHQFGHSSSSRSVDEHNLPQQPPSMESLVAEAMSYSNEENESLDAKAQKALECPCIAHLRTGPCGSQFSEAFLCFLKSTAEEKGSDCVHPFVALQNCIKVNPDAFSKDILEENADEKIEEPTQTPQEYKIIPPLWSIESKRPKTKL
ncbi:hypothetical protein NMG60_11021596 [Bertholletia excelsa]